MGVNITEPRETYIQSNAEPEANPAVRVVWRGGEARRQKGRLGGRKVGEDLLGGLHSIENEEECSDIENREGSWVRRARGMSREGVVFCGLLADRFSGMDTAIAAMLCGRPKIR
jgi:hypothetical protein